jgi:hypothetical protein
MEYKLALQAQVKQIEHLITKIIIRKNWRRMNHVNFFAGNRVASLCAALVVSGVIFFPVKDMAGNVTMNDGGSSATVNLGGGTGNIGMNNWDVGGPNQLNQQWFWYSIPGVNLGVAQSIDTISAATVLTASGSDGINDLLATYQNNQLTVNVEYMLMGNGAGSGSADLGENLTILNSGLSEFTLKFYQYSDFNLLGGANDIVSMYGTPYNPSDPFSGYNGALQLVNGSTGSGIAELVNAPNANNGEANTVGGVNSTLYKLNNTANLTLNDNVNAGPGDVTWALEWDATLAAGQSLSISKDKGLAVMYSIVPEPTTMAFIALGLGVLGLARRRQSS